MRATELDGTDLSPLLALFQELWRQDPRCVTCSYGQIAFWSANVVHGEHEARAWYDGGRLAGWGWQTRGVELEWQVRPECPELFDEILDWAAPEEVLVPEYHADAIARLERHGLRHDEQAPWMRFNHRELAEIEEPSVPDGFCIRTVREADHVSRAAAHRSAFHPSRFRDDVYAAVRASAAYRPELDCVVAAPDGSIAAYALAWFDDENLLGELEPVGTHADYRRLGLGRAVNLFALQQLRSLGATQALVQSRGDAEYPVPSRLYESVGFALWGRTLAYRSASAAA
jgi:ribosomal protein S18 acetylase RimI-like enzyme